jgi:hypothetical protein
MTKAFQDILAIEVEKVQGPNSTICPFIMGEPGIGKSSVVRAMCEDRGWHFFELLCNQLGDRADLTGCRSIKETVEVDGKMEEIWKQIFFPHQSVQDAITCAKNHPDDIVVLFLDEINRTNADITSAVLSFTTAKKIGTYEFPGNVRFIVAGNDKGNITALDSASISRFSKFKLVPSATTYMSIEPELNPYIQRVLKANPQFIFGKSAAIVTTQNKSDDDDESYTSEYETFDDAAEGFQQITTPRTISGLNAFLNACDMNMLNSMVSQTCTDDESGETHSMLEAIVQGHVGNTLFANAVCQEIADDLNRGIHSRLNAIAKPKKPSCYSSLMRCTDRQTRDTMLSKLNEEDLSSILVYACWEKNVDNSDIIEATARHFHNALLSGTAMSSLVGLKSHDEVDADNYNALMNTGIPLTNTLKSIFPD